jgi:hypothetical protein
VREQAALARRHHPECRLWLSAQGLTAEETDGLLRWLDRERPDYVEGVGFGPFGELMTFGSADGPGAALSQERYRGAGPIAGPVSRLRAALPGQYRLVLYPDETHTYRCQYPVVGMDPAVQLVWHREDAPSPRPLEMAALHAATAPFADGSTPYSEGTTDDVNKVVWSALDWSPELRGEEIAAQYARWHFGPVVAADATRLILTVEQALNGPLWGSPLPAEARALAEACEAAVPALLDDWRWLVLRLGALMLDYIQRVQVRDRALGRELRYRVAGFRTLPDPTPELHAAIAFLEHRLTETDALLDECVWTRDRLFARNRLAVRGVVRLQRSYMRWDVLLERWQDVLARLEQGELPSFAEKRAALLQPLEQAEASQREAGAGVRVVEHLRELEWESGPKRWG